MLSVFLLTGLTIFLGWLITHFLKPKETIKWCDRIIEWGIPLVAFIIPLYFDIHLYSTFDLSKVGLMYILTLIMLVAWLIKMMLTQNYKSISTPINLAVLGFFTSTILSTIFSIDPMMSLIGTYKRYEGLLAITCYIIQFFLIINFINTEAKLYRLLKAIIYAGLSSACYGMIQHFGKDPLSWESWNPWRIISSFGNPVFYSAYAEMAILATLGMYFYVKGEKDSIKKGIVIPPKPTTAKAKKKKKKKIEAKLDVNVSSVSQTTLLWRWLYAIKTSIIFIYFSINFNKISAPITLGEPEPSFWIAYSPLMAWLVYLSISIIFLILSFRKQKSPLWLLVYELSGVIGFFSFNFFSFSIKYWAVLVVYLCVCLGYVVFVTLPISAFGMAFIYGSIVCLTFYGFSHCNTRGSYIGLFLGAFLFLIMIISNKEIIKQKKRVISLGVILLLIFIKFNFLISDTSVISRFTSELFSFGKSKTTIEEEVNTTAKEDIASEEPEKTFYPQVKPKKLNLPIPGITATLLDHGHLELKSSMGPKVVVTLPWRAYIWGSAIATIKAKTRYFLFGAGPDTMGFVFPKYVYSILPPEMKGPIEFEDRAHNDICDTLLARGTIGLAVYVWLLIVFFIAGIRYYLKIEGNEKFIVLGLVCSVLGFLGQNLVSFGVTPLSSGFWILLGTAMVAGKLFLQPSPTQPNKYPEPKVPTQIKNQPTKLILCVAIIGGAILLTYFTIRAYKADNFYKDGTVWLHHGDMDTAIAKYEQAIKLHPYEVRYRDECNRLYIEKARNTNDKNWTQKATNGAYELLELTSYRHSNAYFTLAIANFIEGRAMGNPAQIDKAIIFYKKAVSINPFLADAYNNLGVIYTERNMLDEAIYAFKEAYRLNVTHIAALENLARIFLNKQDFENAALVFEEILQANPKYKTHEILNALGMIYFRQGKIDKVIKQCKKIIELDPTNIPAYENLGSMYYQKGNLKEAKEVFNKILQLQPNNAKANQMLRAISFQL
ncbi:MAG: tetratricopeptide repeat protein [bacterium]